MIFTAYFFMSVAFLHKIKLELFDLEVKGQGPTKVIMIRNTSPYGHAPTHQISLTYLEKKMLWPRQENTI
jgi:hypothetical protein